VVVTNCTLVTPTFSVTVLRTASPAKAWRRLVPGAGLPGAWELVSYSIPRTVVKSFRKRGTTSYLSPTAVPPCGTSRVCMRAGLCVPVVNLPARSTNRYFSQKKHLPSITYCLPSTVYCLLSTVYRLPAYARRSGTQAVYCLPSTVYRLPSTVYPLPLTSYLLSFTFSHYLPAYARRSGRQAVYCLLSTVYCLPSTPTI
jgi:hypothetical protein